jgi:DNA-binding NarL/FixJ family response regulator
MTTTRVPRLFGQSKGRLAPPRAEAGLPYALTSGELVVLRLITDGLYDPQIAEALDISEAAVKDRTGSIVRKMNARSRTEAAVKAIREHIFTSDVAL